jgi:hypothetical protein
MAHAGIEEGLVDDGEMRGRRWAAVEAHQVEGGHDAGRGCERSSVVPQAPGDEGKVWLGWDWWLKICEPTELFWTGHEFLRSTQGGCGVGMFYGMRRYLLSGK